MQSRYKSSTNCDSCGSFIRVTFSGGPRVYMAAKSVAYRGKGINLTCEVVSRAPYTVYWRRGTDRIGGPLFFKWVLDNTASTDFNIGPTCCRDTESIVWSLPQVDSRNTGHYTCEVISTSGNASATTELQTMGIVVHTVHTLPLSDKFVGIICDILNCFQNRCQMLPPLKM